MYFQSNNKSECCACTACVNACPKSSISMVQDDEGFSYPIIDKASCIDCHLCESVCPVEHPDYSNAKEPDTYAVLLKDIEERKRSSSGGVFYAIASYVIEKGGIVVGSTMDEKHQVQHIAVDSKEELYRLRGSKYVQSSLEGGIFAIIKQTLQQDRWCYFVGTGCQVAGLKAYLRKKYSKLITSDLVCHGVPSQKLFDQHIVYLERKYHDRVVDYQFRNNKFWGVCEIVDFTTKKRITNPSYELSPFLYSFMYAMTYRYSCYDCKFACIPRQGDITLGDYWGVRNFFPSIDVNNGVSLVLVNTEQGKNVWEHVKNDCDYYQSTVVDGAKYNGNLIRPSEKPHVRDVIYQRIASIGYKRVAQSTFKSPNIWKIKLVYILRNSKMNRIYLYIRNIINFFIKKH